MCCTSVLSSFTAAFVVPLEGMCFHRGAARGTHSPCFQEATVKIFSPSVVLTLDFTVSLLAAKEPGTGCCDHGLKSRQEICCMSQSKPRSLVHTGRGV